MSDSHRRITEPRPRHVSDGVADLPAPTPAAEQAEAVRGGEVSQVEQEIVSPRDASSGLPTGKRMHKPFTIG